MGRFEILKSSKEKKNEFQFSRAGKMQAVGTLFFPALASGLGEVGAAWQAARLSAVADTSSRSGVWVGR